MFAEVEKFKQALRKMFASKGPSVFLRAFWGWVLLVYGWRSLVPYMRVTNRWMGCGAGG